jgi:dipeptidyl-peptidase-3
VIPDADCALTGYEVYARSTLTWLRLIPEGDRIEEDHLRGHHLIVRWAMERGGIAERRKGDRYFLVVEDMAKTRAAVGELLAELMRIKAEGDHDAIRALVDKYGSKLNTAWRDDAIRRLKRIRFPFMTAEIPPFLDAVRAKDGTIRDVRLRLPKSLKAAMLEWSDLSRAEPVAAD